MPKNIATLEKLTDRLTELAEKHRGLFWQNAELNHLLRENEIQKAEEFARFSHEMKKPLSVIRSLISSCSAKNSAKKVERMTREIDSEISRAAKLLDDMIALAHFETHPAEKIKIDFSKICERAAEVTERNFADHHFESEIEPAVEILATPEHLHAIVENLCENAGQHTPAGTQIFLNLKKENERVILSVADDGAGFDPTKKEKILEPFFAFGENRGSGLGLAVVRRAVEKLGGLLEIESREKTGARFVVSFGG